MSQDTIRDGGHDLLDNPLWRAAVVVEAASLLGDLVGKALHLPHLRTISRAGEAAAFIAGYASVMHQIRVEDEVYTSSPA